LQNAAIKLTAKFLYQNNSSKKVFDKLLPKVTYHQLIIKH